MSEVKDILQKSIDDFKNKNISSSIIGEKRIRDAGIKDIFVNIVDIMNSNEERGQLIKSCLYNVADSLFSDRTRCKLQTFDKAIRIEEEKRDGWYILKIRMDFNDFNIGHHYFWNISYCVLSTYACEENEDICIDKGKAYIIIKSNEHKEGIAKRIIDLIINK